MLSSSLDTLLKVSKTTSPQKLFAYDCVTLYIKTANIIIKNFGHKLQGNYEITTLRSLDGICYFHKKRFYTIFSSSKRDGRPFLFDDGSLSDDGHLGTRRARSW